MDTLAIRRLRRWPAGKQYLAELAGRVHQFLRRFPSKVAVHLSAGGETATGTSPLGNAPAARPDEATEHSLSGSLLVGTDLRLETRVGRGASALVYRATRVRDGAPVAVKVQWPRRRRIPYVLRRIVERCLARQPDDRPPSMEALGLELDRAAAALARMEEHKTEPDGPRHTEGATLAYRSPAGGWQVHEPSRDSGTSELAAADCRLGRFRILDTLGSGGMGVVVEAYDDLRDRTVALKLLHPWSSEQTRARLLRGAKAFARISHPNVVQIYEIDTVDDNTFVAMELVRGQDLHAWGRQPHSWRAIVDVYVQAGEGLAAAHAEGLVHRDFKPANCIIGDNGRVRLVDFGLAREVGLGGGSGELRDLEPDVEAFGDKGGAHEGPPREASEGPEPPLASGEDLHGEPLTVTGTLLGTVPYMAYEQLRGRTADALSDQFSFCASLWEALYGVRAFAGNSPYELVTSLKRHRLNPIPKDTDVPRSLRRVLIRGLALDPVQRWPSMNVLLERLREVSRRRRRWGIGSLLVVWHRSRRGLTGGTQDPLSA